MKILIGLTYYRPHTSGLTIYAERLAKALVERGHEVTILTSQFDKKLPKHETQDGVNIIRIPVLFRISKGVIMPSFGFVATKLIMKNDILHLHLPQFDAAGLALRGFLFGKPTIITYHCDLLLPKGLFNWFVNQSVHLMNFLACSFSDRIVTYTADYADNSSLLKRFSKKITIIDPPVELPEVKPQQLTKYQSENNPENQHPIIGIAARFATEKGVEILISAMEKVINIYPKAQVWFAGPYQNIIGEKEYFQKLHTTISMLEKRGNWKFLGLLNPREMALFYSCIDMLTIPSLNSTEAFGLVQIEAMINGKPSIASNLPGVRQPVIRHKFGSIFPVGDVDALAEAILDVCSQSFNNKDQSEIIRRRYSPGIIAEQFEKLFYELMSKRKN